MDSLNEAQPSDDVRIAQDRRMIALEATWEIEQLTTTIRELCDAMLPSNEAGSPLRLRVRGLTSRINDLVGVTMSVLDEDCDTDRLSTRVYGPTDERRATAGGTTL